MVILHFIHDTSPYDGPTSMEELRALKYRPDPALAVTEEMAAQRCAQTSGHRDQIVAMIGQGMKGVTIAKALGISPSLVSKVRKGER